MQTGFGGRRPRFSTNIPVEKNVRLLADCDSADALHRLTPQRSATARARGIAAIDAWKAATLQGILRLTPQLTHARYGLMHVNAITAQQLCPSLLSHFIARIDGRDPRNSAEGIFAVRPASRSRGCPGGIARCRKISILYMPTLLRTPCRGRRREHRAYDDDSRNQLFREAPWQLR